MSFINIDQKHRLKPLTHADVQRTTKGIFLGFILAICFMATFAKISESRASDALAYSVTGATYDNLMSVEMAAFTVLNPGTYDEGDMQ